MTRLLFVSSLLLVVASFVGMGAAQWQDLPDCGAKCASDAMAGHACGTDVGCLCNNQDFINAAYNCIFTTCPNEDQGGSLGNMRAVCDAAPAPAPPSSSEVPSSSAAAGSSSSSGPAPVTVTGASSSASTPAPVTTPTAAITTPTAAPVTTPTGRITTSAAGGNVVTVSNASFSSQSTLVVVATQSADDTGNILNGAGSLRAAWGVIVGSAVVGAVLGAGLV